MLLVVEAIKRELGLPNEIEGAVSIITAANAYYYMQMMKNFIIYYELDGQTVTTLLRLEEYDGVDEASWVLLEAESEAETQDAGETESAAGETSAEPA